MATKGNVTSSGDQPRVSTTSLSAGRQPAQVQYKVSGIRSMNKPAMRKDYRKAGR
jgi:hypothetical protein